MRRSGRTTRIKNFIVDQLMSVGGCVATDHTSFEHGVLPLATFRHLIMAVEKDIYEMSNGNLVVKYKIHNSTEGINFIIFRTELKKTGDGSI